MQRLGLLRSISYEYFSHMILLVRGLKHTWSNSTASSMEEENSRSWLGWSRQTWQRQGSQDGELYSHVDVFPIQDWQMKEWSHKGR